MSPKTHVSADRSCMYLLVDSRMCPEYKCTSGSQSVQQIDTLMLLSHLVVRRSFRPGVRHRDSEGARERERRRGKKAGVVHVCVAARRPNVGAPPRRAWVSHSVLFPGPQIHAPGRCLLPDSLLCCDGVGLGQQEVDLPEAFAFVEPQQSDV